MTEHLLFYAFKGGVSKSTTTSIVSYILAEIYQKKVLVVDLEPQADVTKILNKTYHKRLETKPVLDFYLKNRLVDNVISFSEYLDVIPSDWDITKLTNRLPEKDIYTLKQLLIPVLEKGKYDYVLYDIAPTINNLTNNVLAMVDTITLLMLPQMLGYEAVLTTGKYLAEIKQDYQLDFDVSGVLTVMYNTNQANEVSLIRLAKLRLGDSVLTNDLPTMKRVQRWTAQGIRWNDKHDDNAMQRYIAVTREILRLDKPQVTRPKHVPKKRVVVLFPSQIKEDK